MSGFNPIATTASKSAMSGSIFADPATCFVIVTAFPARFSLALPTANATSRVRHVSERRPELAFGRLDGVVSASSLAARRRCALAQSRAG